MPLESGADGEARMETDQPWVGVRVPERAGCWPPARSIPASLLLQGRVLAPARSMPASLLLQDRVLAPRPQHPCFSPASGLGAGPARSIPASLLLQGWVLAPRLQHPCFSPACLLPLSHPFPGRHFLNMKQKKQIVTYNLLPCQRRCIF